VTETDMADVLIYWGNGNGRTTPWLANIFDIDTNTTREVEWAVSAGVDPVDLDTRAGLILQNTRHHGVRLLDLDGNELHRSNDWITAGKNVASSQFFGVEQFVTVGDKNATVWSSTSYDALCSCKLNETITSATFDPSGRRFLTVSESGVAVWDSQDCGLLFHIADRGNYSACKLQDVVGFVGLDHIAMLHTDGWMEHYVPAYYEYYDDYLYHSTGADLTFHDASTGKELYTVPAPDPGSLTLVPEGHFALHVSPEGSNVAFAYRSTSQEGGLRDQALRVFNSEGALLTDFTGEEEGWSMWHMSGFDPTGTQVLVDQRKDEVDMRSCFAAAYDVASGLKTRSMHYSKDVASSTLHFLGNGTRVVANSGCSDEWGSVSSCVHVWDFASGTELAVLKHVELLTFGTVPVVPASLVLV